MDLNEKSDLLLKTLKNDYQILRSKVRADLGYITPKQKTWFDTRCRAGKVTVKSDLDTVYNQIKGYLDKVRAERSETNNGEIINLRSELKIVKAHNDRLVLKNKELKEELDKFK